MRLQDKDLKILHLSYEQRVLRADHLERYLYRGKTDRAVRKRLMTLEKAGLLRREDALQIGGRRLLRLTPAGIKLVESGRETRIPQARKLDLATLVHDGHVTTMRLRLEELWDGRWFPEALLKHEEFPQIPDGLWIFPNGHRVAIEVECSDKGVSRFHALQERWRRVEVRLVLYVAVGAAMSRILRRYIESGPQDLPFGLVKLEELEAGAPRVWTRLGELDLLSRRTF